MAAGKYVIHEAERLRTTRAKIESATVIEAGDLVTIASGYIIKAVAASTAVAFCPDGHAAGAGTVCEVTVGNDFTLKGTADANFAITNKGTQCDIVNDGTQNINMDASATKVLAISISEDAGVAGSAAGIVVRINLPLF